MDDFLPANATWSAVKTWLCSQPNLVNLYKLNITCGDSSTNSQEGIPSEALKLVSVAAILFAIGVLGNITLLIAARRDKRTLRWNYTASLAIADMLIMPCMAGFILYIISTPTNWSASWHNYLFPSLDIFVTSASILSVTAIAVDRVVEVRQLVAVGRARSARSSDALVSQSSLVITCIWGYSALIFGLSFCRIFITPNQLLDEIVFWTATTVVLFAAVMLTLASFVIIILYYITYNVARTQLCRPVSQLLRDDGCNTDVSMVRVEKSNGKKITTALYIVLSLLPFVMGWSFYLCTQTYEYVSKRFITNYHFNLAMIVVPWALSALNPFLYMIASASSRKQVYASVKSRIVFSSRQCCTQGNRILLPDA